MNATFDRLPLKDDETAPAMHYQCYHNGRSHYLTFRICLECHSLLANGIMPPGMYELIKNLRLSLFVAVVSLARIQLLGDGLVMRNLNNILKIISSNLFIVNSIFL